MSTSPLLASPEASPRPSRDLEKCPLPYPVLNPPSSKPSPIALRRALIALGAASLLLLSLSRLHIDVNYYSVNVFPTLRREVVIPAVPQVVVHESAPKCVVALLPAPPFIPERQN